MKKCRKCLEQKEISDYPKTGSRHDGSQKYSPDCKNCYRARRNEKFRQRLQGIIGEITCVNCGYSKCFGAIEFHHIDPESKSKCVKTMTNRPEEELKEELAKCVMVCANCHREIHARMLDVKEEWRCRVNGE